MTSAVKRLPQSEWLAQLLSRRDPATGDLKVSALDLNHLHAKTSEAQAAAFRDSLKLIAELLKDLGITDDVCPGIRNFKPSCTMNEVPRCSGAQGGSSGAWGRGRR